MSEDNTQLTVLNNEVPAFATSMKLFNNLTPDILGIIQSNTTAVEGKKGRLYVSGTGDQYDEVHAVLIEPFERRDYFAGNPAEMNRTADNLLCFSTDLVHPHKNAKVPQAMNCANCSHNADVHANWEAWEALKAKGAVTKGDAPQCQSYYIATFLDTVYQLPLKMYFRGSNKKPSGKSNFEKGMQQLQKERIKASNVSGIPVNFYDISFKITTKSVTEGKFTFFVPVFSDFKLVTPEDSSKFGAFYKGFVNSRVRSTVNQPEETVAQAVNESNSTINTSIEGEYLAGDGEINI